MLKSIIRTLL
jgi:predicted DNA-binding transcriptional regulator AlpA